MAAIEEHRQCVNEFIAKICKTRNTKILSKQKYNHIVTFLKSGDVLLDKEAKSKLRWYIKSKNFAMVNFSCLSLKDVLCIPAKNKVSSTSILLNHLSCILMNYFVSL